MQFREVDGSYHLDFHVAPRRQLVVNLTGSVEIEVGSGERRVLGPGSILLAEDTTGQGHISRDVVGEPRTCLFVHLDDDLTARHRESGPGIDGVSRGRLSIRPSRRSSAQVRDIHAELVIRQ